MSCCQRSSCTRDTVKAWTAISFGVGIMSIIPLVIGCLGKYGVIPLDRPLFQGMITSGSIGTALGIITVVGIILARKTNVCAPVTRLITSAQANMSAQLTRQPQADV